MFSSVICAAKVHKKWDIWQILQQFVTLQRQILNPLFILLWINACGTFEISAEISGVGKTELVGGLLHCLLRIRVHDAFRLRRHILLNPFQG